jgi:hypothetical protein
VMEITPLEKYGTDFSVRNALIIRRPFLGIINIYLGITRYANPYKSDRKYINKHRSLHAFLPLLRILSSSAPAFSSCYIFFPPHTPSLKAACSYYWTRMRNTLRNTSVKVLRVMSN